MREIRPQPGPQSAFLESAADIVIYGGAAGGGKSYGLCLDDLYHVGNGQYSSVTFRRTFPQILNPGGLWDTAGEIFPHVGAKSNLSRLEWRFPSGAVVKFAHMQHESDKLQWQGSQIGVIKFDELDHFSESMFFYMLSRNRSVSGIRPYMRGTCNANADSWVAGLISWWIDWETGFPIPERAGAVRWFVRDGAQMLWADRAHDLPWVSIEIDGIEVPQPPKSLTFIPARVTDNKALLSKDPAYLASLLALPPVDRGRLLDGNWKVRPAAGDYFKRHWFEIVDAAPAHAQRVRFWDFAATKARPGRDPDWTAGVLLSRTVHGLWTIEDIRRIRDTPASVERLVRQTAEGDGLSVPVYLEQEPGSSGKIVADYYIREVLRGFTVYATPSTGKKDERAKPVSSQAQAGNMRVVRGPWNADFFSEAEGFPDPAYHDDQVDGLSGAFAALAGPTITGNRTAVSGPRPGLAPQPPSRY